MAFLKWLKGIGKNTLYYPGCLTKFVMQKEMENYKKILNKLGIDYIMINEELCCGMPVINSGYEKDARKLARKNLEIFKKYSVGKIITNCPSCYAMLKNYKELLPDWDIKVEHITLAIFNMLNKLKKIKKAEQEATYHDPCHLGRHSGIYEEPRKILNLFGYKLKEMRNNKEESLCCGGGGGLRNNETEIAGKIAKERIKQAKEVANKIITPCPMCFKHMEENSDAGKIEVEEFSHAIGKALGIIGEEKPFKEGEEK